MHIIAWRSLIWICFHYLLSRCTMAVGSVVVAHRWKGMATAATSMVTTAARAITLVRSYSSFIVNGHHCLDAHHHCAAPKGLELKVRPRKQRGELEMLARFFFHMFIHHV